MNMDCWSGVTILLGCMLFPAATLPLLKPDNVKVDTILSQDEKCTLCIVSPSVLRTFCPCIVIDRSVLTQTAFVDAGCH